MSELAHYQQQPTDLATQHDADPTGGRLVAWAQAAQAANSLARALSTTTFVPKGMTDVGNATAAILMGDELGLSPLAALRSIYVVHGTPALYARSMVALAQSHGHDVWTTESTDSKVTVQGRRKGTDHIETATWTMQRAAKAGYTGNKKYDSNPQEMLYSKAAAEVARKIAADVLAGLPYSVEDIELGDAPTTTVTSEAAGKRTVSRKKAKPEPEPEPVDMTDAPEVPAEDLPQGASDSQKKRMFALLGELGINDRDKYLKLASWHTRRDLTSTSEMTAAEVSAFIDYLQGRINQQPPADEPADDGQGALDWPDVQEPGA